MIVLQDTVTALLSFNSLFSRAYKRVREVELNFGPRWLVGSTWASGLTAPGPQSVGPLPQP